MQNKFINFTTSEAYGGGYGANVVYSSATGPAIAGFGNIFADGTTQLSDFGISVVQGVGFDEFDRAAILGQAALAGFTQFDRFRPDYVPNTQPTAPVSPTASPTSPSTNPSAPTSNPSITSQNSPANPISPPAMPSGNIFQNNQAIGWATFASQVQGTQMFNQVQQGIQNLLGGVGQGTGGEVVQNLISNIQSGQATSIGGGQAADRLTKSNRKKIGYEELKTFDKASQAATLGKPTLLGE